MSRQPLPEAFGEGHFTTRSAVDAELAGHLFYKGRTDAPFGRGFRVAVGVKLELAARAKSVLKLCPPGTAISGPTALAHWRLPLPPVKAPPPAEIGRGPEPVAEADPQAAPAPEPPIEVTVPAPATPPRRPGIKARQAILEPADTVELEGVLVLSPARLFLDMAPQWRCEHAVALGDAILRRALTSEQCLIARVDRAAGQRGLLKARAALVLLDGRAKSPQESRVRVRILQAGLPAPEVNCSVVLSSGRVLRPDAKIRLSPLQRGG